MKVKLAGEWFDYDGSKCPVSEALAIEKVYQRRYAEWQTDLAAGSAKAMCVLAWVIWRRDGRAVPFDDILDGTADFDLNEMISSLAESAEAELAAQADADEEAAAGANPTPPAPAPGGTATTAPGTSGSSRKPSGTPRKKSTPSPSKSSKA